MMEKVKLFAAKQYVSAQENYIFNEDMLRRVELHSKIGKLHVEQRKKEADAAEQTFVSILQSNTENRNETVTSKEETVIPRVVI